MNELFEAMAAHPVASILIGCISYGACCAFVGEAKIKAMAEPKERASGPDSPGTVPAVLPAPTQGRRGTKSRLP